MEQKLDEIFKINLAHWYEVDDMAEWEKEIQNILKQLDNFAKPYRNRWGVGVLNQDCSTDLKQKWNNQCQKFNDALVKKDVELVRDLASGFKRAYEALEADLLNRGYTPLVNGKTLSSVDENGFKMIVCEDQDALKIATARNEGENTQIWTIDEVRDYIKKTYKF